MANPNIASLTEIYGNTTSIAVTTSWSTILTCPSNKVCKINSIIVSNIDGTNSADINIDIGGYYIARTIAVPADTSLVVVSKDTGLYLEESVALRCYASANSDLHIVVSYEQIG
jgi:hypothetical protein